MRFIAAFFLTVSAASASTLGQQTIVLSGSASPLSCAGQRYVNKLTIRVIPGFVGKVVIGSSGLDPNSYSNAIAILFPNLGAHSEEYVVQDPSGDDGIDLCSIYVAGEVPGENAIAEYVSNTDGTVAPQYVLMPATGAAVPPYYSFGVYNCALIRFQSIPGIPLQTQLSGANNGESIFLDPNMGDISQHSGWSESWERSDPLGGNGLYASITMSSMDNAGSVLLSTWDKQDSSGAFQIPQVHFDWLAGYIDVGDLAGVVPWPSGTLSARIHKVPGQAFDSKDEIDDAQGNPVGLLFPNTTSTGWSEGMDFGPGSLGQLSAVTDSGSLDRVGYDALVVDGSAVSLPGVLAAVGAPVGGYVTGGSSISRGYVKRIRVQVVPGGDGLVFLGTSTMNTATLDGVYAILYPNSVGRWSETFELDDPEGDGISTDDLYVQTEVPGEQVIVSTITTGITPPDGVLTVKASGALSGNFGSYSVPFAAASTPVTLLRAQAIPGGYEKLWIGTAGMTAAQPDPGYANVLKVLWPSQGNFDVGEGHSERFIQSCSTGPANAPNCLDLQSFTFWPELPWEQLLVFALGR